MAAIGNNYTKRHQRPSLKEINKAWANQRHKSIKQAQTLRQQFSSSIFTTNVLVSQQQTANAIRGSSYGSMATAMARVNLLV